MTTDTIITEQNIEELRRQLEESWPSPIVARRDVEAFSGGLLRRGTLANHDSKGTGPREKFDFREGVAYGKAALLDWMFNRLIAKPKRRTKTRKAS